MAFLPSNQPLPRTIQVRDSGVRLMRLDQRYADFLAIEGQASRRPVNPSSAGSSVSEAITVMATVAAAAIATPFSATPAAPASR